MFAPAPLIRRSTPVFLALLSLLPTALCAAQTPPAGDEKTADARIDSLLDQLSKVRTPVTATISPDGQYVAWTFTENKKSELHLTGLAPKDAAQDGAWERVISPDTIGDVTNMHPGACSASHPAWSPNGKQLAFLSDCDDADGSLEPTSQDNIFVWTLATNAMKQVSHLHGNVSDLKWSPDGKAIGFLFVANATRRAGALDAMKPWNGVIGEDNVEIQQVAAVDPSGQHFEPVLVRSPHLHVYEFTWAPNSQRIAFVGSNPPGEDNWWVAKLYIEELEPMEGCDARGFCAYDGPPIPDPAILVDPITMPGALHGLQIAVPRFSPDGKQIAFIGGLMSDQGSTGGNIYVVQLASLDDIYDRIRFKRAIPKDITPNRPASPAWIQWRNDHSLLVSEHVGGSSHLTVIDPQTGKDVPGLDLTLPETIIAGTDIMSISTSNTENVALIRQSFDHPPEVWAGPLKNLKQISHLNDSQKPLWGRSESIDYTNDGFHIQGWLLYPANYDPAKRYPLLVSVHGGPSGAVTPRWPTATYGATPFSALGYFVFMPNPRGSFGQGEKFTQANVKDFGYGDLRDVLAGLDLLEKRFPIDKYREGITGWSYGGFMTMFAVTQTNRFHAAVAGAGISNWQSYYGENSIDQWMIPFFGASVYDDPAIYAKSSPITYIKRVKTPTLLVVGDRDGECPAPQSFEFWHALRDEGVKTQLVIYPNEGHHFVSREHQRDVLKRALSWFETQMPAK
jgi:dipeptidyl aminopeptidase/acylaminoacyl peptidase